jgi:GAF domain-containing protein
MNERREQVMDVAVPAIEEHFVEEKLTYLGKVTGCSAAVLLVVTEQRGQMMIWCTRPVDELFLQAAQKRVVASYQACVGPAMAEPEIRATIYGDAIAGLYRPLRSLLTVPLLIDGRVTGMLAIVSVSPDAFSSQDVCTLAAVATEASAVMSGACCAAGEWVG